jgi:hypothetical protein
MLAAVVSLVAWPTIVSLLVVIARAGTRRYGHRHDALECAHGLDP